MEQTVPEGTVEGRGSAMDFSTSSEVPSDDVSTPMSGTKSVHAPRFEVKTDAGRDALLTEFGKETLRDRYLLPGESYQDLFARVAAGELRVVEGAVYPLSEARRAHEDLRARRTVGKLVLDPAS
jgi:NADPH:quinone reductase-like Zn-dependent oxidoreductase